MRGGGRSQQCSRDILRKRTVLVLAIEPRVDVVKLGFEVLEGERVIQDLQVVSRARGRRECKRRPAVEIGDETACGRYYLGWRKRRIEAVVVDANRVI